MTTPPMGEAVPKTYLVTVTETYRVEADSEAAAIAEVRGLRSSTRADTVDVQVEAAG
jgi:hypothetical protein